MVAARPLLVCERLRQAAAGSEWPVRTMRREAAAASWATEAERLPSKPANMRQA